LVATLADQFIVLPRFLFNKHIRALEKRHPVL
jgi:hypothetical protein